MPYLYLTLVVFLASSSTIFGKFYNLKNKNSKDLTTIYNFIYIISILLGWGLIYIFNFSFDSSVLIYALLFGLSPGGRPEPLRRRSGAGTGTSGR